MSESARARIQKHLQLALDAEEPGEVGYHLRQAEQLNIKRKQEE